MPPEKSIFLGDSDEADIRFKVVHGLNAQPRNRPLYVGFVSHLSLLSTLGD